MHKSHVQVATPRASRYLQQMCKHFAHKVPVTFDAAAGDIDFGVGACRLTAEGDILRIEVAAAEDEPFARLKDAVVSHLERFAFREELTLTWQES